MKHTSRVRSFPGPHQQLAEEIGDLYYDALADFLHLLAAKIDRDAGADQARGRVKLAAELRSGAGHVEAAAGHIRAAWRICEPHMRAWLAAHPEDQAGR